MSIIEERLLLHFLKAIGNNANVAQILEDSETLSPELVINIFCTINQLDSKEQLRNWKTFQEEVSFVHPLIYVPKVLKI